ncbi:SepM family pheromone-processing serine protease [Bacillus sp. S/N-304-OC-R1]|uniref:SepM family pheromone-processing serine protease n=1 Tax=Bacillus sp. S/N-304-OC-R1 TaxID=2758034 RepID=UPI001C8D6F1D|nr:SepM family pheromone-processing serine protease [Bacillus sp. S/N-304-OC-R1]MBY0124150.1 PDZ domain-containing protein [Bacillus sp. S/N-304-OC-R1]
MKVTLKHKRTRILLGLLLIIILTLIIPTPYYLYQPGSAEELATRVNVENGDKEEDGGLYLTTILSVDASNIYYLIYGLFAPYTEIRKAEQVKGDLSDEEYDRLLKHMMDSSQQNAISSSMKAAGERADRIDEGIIITSILGESKAKGVLHVGDVITSINGHPLKVRSDLLKYLSDKQPKDKVSIGYKRGKKESLIDVELIELEQSTNKAGLGIMLEDQVSIATDRKVDIKASDIGGPSAGLMFSLEIYNQLTPGDLTKGYKIAGTGTIDLDGNVGQIGGIRDKIIAAHKEGIEIFFCPQDIQATDTNQKDAIDEVKKRGYKMKIVPVKTMEEAIRYLDKLPGR